MHREHLYVISAGILAGTVVLGDKLLSNAGLSVYQIAVLPLLVTLLLGIYIFLNREKKEFRWKKGMLTVLLAFGLWNALGPLCEITPVVLGVPVAITVLLLYTQPVWTIIFSRLFLKEKITAMKMLSVLIVVAGVLILVNPFQMSGVGSTAGVFIALLGGVFMSGWVIFGRVCANRKYHPVVTKFSSTVFTLVFLAALYPLIRLISPERAISHFSFNIPAITWMYVILFGIISNISVHLFYYAGAKKVPASTSGIILLIEPLVAAILSAIILGQAITLNMFIGGFLILASNYLVIRGE